MIGIDKIVLNKVDVISIDWEKFNRHPATSVKLATKEHSAREISKVVFSRISSGTHANQFTFEAKMSPDKNTGEWIPTERLCINPATLLYGSNVRNIETSDELKTALDIVAWRINDEYGIKIDLSHARISEIEINVNIKLEQPFGEYDKVFEFVRKSLPARYKKTTVYDENGQATGFSVQNTQVLLKFYDKLREAQVIVDGTANLLRVEYRYRCQDKVKTVLGLDKLEDLLQNFESIKGAFIKNITSDILTTGPKLLDRRIKQHERDLILAMEEQPKAFIDRWLAITEIIFDYELLRQTLLNVLLKKGRKPRNNRDRIQQLRNAVEKRQEETALFGQLDLLNNLIEKIKANCGII